MKIYFATDHAGYELKNELIKYVGHELHYQVEDLGNTHHDKSDDFPDFISLAAKKVSENTESARAIILGGSGEGEAMMANRYKGVRATVYYGGSYEIITLSREHNNANVLSLGARFLSTDEARKVVELWLKTSFSEDERHKRRIRKIDAYV
jgi:ribose 5-phosphate isomerase B